MDTILLTGFEPFDGDGINPAWAVAQALHGRRIGAATVVAQRLPCVFGDSLAVLHEALAEHRPCLVLALGQAGGRCDFSIERVAINLSDARIADNAGARPIDEPVVAGAPAAYFATLPIKAMVAALHAAGLPASVSQTAGTFVCNHVFFGLMHAMRHTPQGHSLRLAPQGHALRQEPQVRAGFMHLPLLPEQAAQRPGQPSLPLATLVQGVELALRTALAVTTDLRLSAGAEA